MTISRGRFNKPLEGGLLALGIVVTAIALLPWSPEGPYDARTGQALAGAHVTYPWAGALIEPAAAIGHALSGAPSPKVALFATLAWVVVLGLAWGWLRQARGSRRPFPAVATALAMGLILLVYAALYLLVPFPSWQLTTADPEGIVADLQSHTHASHDGMVRPQRSLGLMRDRGIEVAAVTEHVDPSGAFEARRLSRSRPHLPAVIPGVELRAGDGYVLGLGLEPGHPMPDRLHSTAELNAFVRKVHQDHEGAVVALSWRLDSGDVAQMAASGLDGFEIANFGHPEIPAGVVQALKGQAAKRDLALVASSDWHGWSGTWRTWTLVYPDAEFDDAAQAVIRVLRHPDRGRIVPAIAGHIGPPSPSRAIFAPFAESVRYAGELGPARILGWWLWIGLALGLAKGLRTFDLAPGPVMRGGAFNAVALLLVAAALPMAWQPAAGAANPAFHREIGMYGLALGGSALLIGVGLPLARLMQKRRALPR